MYVYVRICECMYDNDDNFLSFGISAAFTYLSFINVLNE
jgi:hypothetical protein